MKKRLFLVVSCMGLIVIVATAIAAGRFGRSGGPGGGELGQIEQSIRDLQIKLAKSGNVAWFFCLLDEINEWKGRAANWENTRWTGVLEKREGRWVMVQQHFSFAAKN